MVATNLLVAPLSPRGPLVVNDCLAPLGRNDARYPSYNYRARFAPIVHKLRRQDLVKNVVNPSYNYRARFAPRARLGGWGRAGVY